MADENIFRRGDRIAEKYVVEHELGRGGMAVVVAARHAELGHEVAIKALLPAALRHESAADRLMREARAAARLQSEHATRVFDVGRLPSGAPFIVLERLRGMDLHALLEARGALPVAEAARAVREACDAVAEAHDSGIVHRDLKPSNLFLARRRDGSALVKVLDFGIAKASAGLGEAALTTTSSSLGTPLYMAPEQIMDAKSVTAAVDVWALGVTLYELVTNDIPWDVQNVHALLAKIVTEPPVPLRRRRPDLPVALEAIVMRCLARAPADRFPDARALAAALAPLASPAPLVLGPEESDLDAPTVNDETAGLVAADTDVSLPPSAVIRDTTTNPVREQLTTEAPTRRQAETPSSPARTGPEWDSRAAHGGAAPTGRSRRVVGAIVVVIAVITAVGAMLSHSADPPASERGEPTSATSPDPSPQGTAATPAAPSVVVEAVPLGPAASASASPPAAGSTRASRPSGTAAAPRASATGSRSGSRPSTGRSPGDPAPPGVPSRPGTSPSSGWGPVK